MGTLLGLQLEALILAGGATFQHAKMGSRDGGDVLEHREHGPVELVDRQFFRE